MPSGWLDALDEEIAQGNVEQAENTDVETTAAPSGWLDALDEELAEETGEQAENTDMERTVAPESLASRGRGKGSGRGRGRPVGSRLMREKRKAAADAAASLEQEVVSPELTSIEKAREALQAKRRREAASTADKRPAVASGRLQAFGNVSQMASIGSTVQLNLLAAAAQSREDLTAEAATTDVLGAHLEGRLLTTPWKALSQLFKESPSTVASKARAAGAAVVEMGSWLWSSMCTFLQPLFDPALQAPGVRPRFRAVLYVMRLRYDETPSRVRVLTSNKHGSIVLPHARGRAEGAASALVRNTEFVESLQPSSGTAAGHESKQRQVAELVEASTQSKILQTEHCTGMLFQDTSSKQFFWLFGEMPTWLIPVDRCTGETTRRCVMDVVEAAPEMRRVWTCFETKLRVSVTDRFGANARCEAGLSQEGFLPEFGFTHVACDVHRLSTSIGASTLLAADDVAGVLSTGLATGSLGATRQLREHLASIFLEELDIVHYPPPSGHVAEQRESLLELLLPSNAPTYALRKRNRLRKFVLRRFLCLGMMGLE